MEWDVNKLLKQIDDYFDNVTEEEFNEALERNGYGLIEPASESEMKMLELEEVK